MFHLYLFTMIISQQLDHRPLGAPCGVVPLRGFLQPLVPVLSLRGGRFLETKPPNLGEVPLFSWKKMMDVLYKFSFDQLGCSQFFRGAPPISWPNDVKWVSHCIAGNEDSSHTEIPCSCHDICFLFIWYLAVSNQKCLSSQVIPAVLPAVSTLTFYPYVPHLYPMLVANPRPSEKIINHRPRLLFVRQLKQQSGSLWQSHPFPVGPVGTVGLVGQVSVLKMW